MRKVVALIIVLVLITGAAGWWVKFEHQPPTAGIDTHGSVVGAHAAWDLTVKAPGWAGLRRVEVLLTANGGTYQVLEKSYPPSSWIGSGVAEDQLPVRAELSPLGVREGPAVLQVAVETYAWQIMSPRRHVVLEKEITVDLAPPSLELLSKQHNLRLGGSSIAVFRAGADTVQAGVAVEDYFFPATLGYFADPTVAVVVFAVPQDLTPGARVQVVASDAVGNSRTASLPCQIRDRKFPERNIEVTENFLQRTIPDIMRINHLPEQGDAVQDYLYVNRQLRAETDRIVREITRQSAPKPLWDGAFRRQSNAATMSFFADRRVYVYGGETIDRQTHLGVDLASVQGATIEAEQNGVVLFAGNLGIYGEAVIIDHGLGVSSLYGHMRSIAVTTGQSVVTGDALGQSGQTGLAGGDHLHLSILVHGIQVDPVEWWDPLWIRNHVAAKLTMLPVAQASEAKPANEEKNEEPTT
jgi:murein DD-endopeptidase MepM/ murein hydrolase activator NlpD